MSRQSHPFYEKHDERLKALWTMDRSNSNVDEKLAKLKEAIGKSSANGLVDIYDEKTGESRAKVPLLLIACFEGDYQTIDYLLDNGANPQETETEHNLTALHVLVDGPYKGQTITESDRAKLIRKMVQKGADVNHIDKHQIAPVHKVAINDRPECLDALIEANVDPNVTFMGERALTIAARQNRDKILKRLLNYPKTALNVTTETGGTVMHFAAAGMIDAPECIELLIQAGLNINAQDQRGNTPLMIACFFNKPRVVQALLNANADKSIKNNEGKDALTMCDERDVPECKALLTK